MNGIDAVFSICFSASGSTLAGGRKSTALSMTRYTMSSKRIRIARVEVGDSSHEHAFEECTSHSRISRCAPARAERGLDQLAAACLVPNGHLPDDDQRDPLGTCAHPV